LRAALEKVLRDPRYRENARRRQAEIAGVNGVARAADLVEKAIGTREPVLR
jgi:UDP:flavonoid glycosyltransferase YjiC (YdhE family)